ncbi:hypothetical protein EK904_002225 [Melospiza melodia maxima]|nr:hypothetical protein EK904_002225 [Melospiza melodia maxima]
MAKTVPPFLPAQEAQELPPLVQSDGGVSPRIHSKTALEEAPQQEKEEWTKKRKEVVRLTS